LNDKLRQLTEQMQLSPGASEDTIVRVQRQLDLQLPNSYLDFIRESNGAEGPVGNSYLALWSIEELPLYNKRDAADELTRSLLQVGSDGGGEAFAFDTRTADMPIVEIPFISIDLSEAVFWGADFEEFLEFLYNREV
jgi:hypothetical protein